MGVGVSSLAGLPGLVRRGFRHRAGSGSSVGGLFGATVGSFQGDLGATQWERILSEMLGEFVLGAVHRHDTTGLGFLLQISRLGVVGVFFALDFSESRRHFGLGRAELGLLGQQVISSGLGLCFAGSSGSSRLLGFSFAGFGGGFSLTGFVLAGFGGGLGITGGLLTALGFRFRFTSFVLAGFGSGLGIASSLLTAFGFRFSLTGFVLAGFGGGLSITGGLLTALSLGFSLAGFLLTLLRSSFGITSFLLTLLRSSFGIASSLLTALRFSFSLASFVFALLGGGFSIASSLFAAFGFGFGVLGLAQGLGSFGGTSIALLKSGLAGIELGLRAIDFIFVALRGVDEVVPITLVAGQQEMGNRNQFGVLIFTEGTHAPQLRAHLTD
jgi:hypothetical protein